MSFYISVFFRNLLAVKKVPLPCIAARKWRHYAWSSSFSSNCQTVGAARLDESLLHHPLMQPEKYEGTFVSSENLPSVTRVLSQTKPIENQLMLEAWKKKMIKQLGVDGFNKMQASTLSSGSKCHSAIQDHLTGTDLKDIVVDEKCSGLWQSVQSVLQDVSSVVSIEHKYVHPHLKYYGYADCVAKYRGQLCSIDWKTSKKIRTSLKECYDDPVQVAAYAGAVNCTLEQHQQISRGLVVKIYHDGQPATPFVLNEFAMEYFWMQWLKRLSAYRDLIKQNSKPS